LERKLNASQAYYNHSRFHASLEDDTPAEINDDRVAQPAPLRSHTWQKALRQSI
jgi:hypothetical protein